MDVNSLNIPDNIIKSLGRHYKDLITKSGQALSVYGKSSTEYALALALLTSAVVTVQVSYGFTTLQGAHEFLIKIS